MVLIMLKKTALENLTVPIYLSIYTMGLDFFIL